MREAIERVGCHKEDKKISEEHLPTHIPSKIVYPLTRLMSDLLDFAALHLKIGARLVTWLPIIRYKFRIYLWKLCILLTKLKFKE